MRPTKLLFAAAVPCVVVASVAIAGQFKNVFVETSTIKTTGISGGTGDETKVGFDQYFIYEIGWNEKNDDPCYFTVNGARRSSDSWEESSATVKLPSACDRTSAVFKVTANKPSSDGSSGKFVSAIQVCRSDKKDSDWEKVKGIRIRTSRVDENGAVTGNAGEDDHYLTHCKTWEDWVSCPAGQLARRLVINGKGMAAKGIGLECAPVYTGSRPHASN